MGSGAEVRLQGSEPGREHAQAHGKNLKNFETGSQKSESFEIAEKIQQVWTISPGESETPSERTPTYVSVDLLEKIPEDTQSKVSTDFLMGGVETDTHVSADLLKGSVKSSRMETETHVSADVLRRGA